MKKEFFSLIICLGITLSAFGVSTGYIGNLTFDQVEEYEFSNISILENGSVELSPQTKAIFSSENMLWSFCGYKNGILVGTGEEAEIYLINEKNTAKVFSKKDHILFSDILVHNNKILVSAVGDSKLFVLDERFNVIKELKFSNQFLWKIIPFDNEIILLSGSPATLYLMNEKYEIIEKVELENEKNLLNGVIFENKLFFFSDSNILYEFDLKTKKLNALLDVGNNIVDIAVSDGIYILTGKPKAPEVKQKKDEKVEKKEDDDISNPITTKSSGSQSSIFTSSILYRFIPEERILEVVFKRSSITFQSMTVSKNKIFIATDKDAGYFEYDLKNSTFKFTSLGKGKLLKLFSLNNEFYAILINPSSILKITENYSPLGFIESSVFDCKIPSRWGEIILQSDITEKSKVEIYTKTGPTKDEKYWEDWKKSEGNKIYSSPNRYIKYKLILYSEGKKSPNVKRIFIPYLQFNVKPVIDNFEINQSGEKYIFSWQASDENNDTLSFDLFLRRGEGEFFKINDNPLDATSFEIQKELLSDGIYYAKLVASDKKSNLIPKENFKITGPVIIDNTPPVVENIKILKNEITFEVCDNLSPVVSVSVSINGGKWEKIQPADGLYDSKKEKFKTAIKENVSFVRLKASDAFGNSAVYTIYQK